MTAVFITILNMSITASIVTLAVMLVRIPLKKAPKLFSYVLWGVVLFRLIFPFSIESAFSLMPTFTNVIPHEIALTQNHAMQTEGQSAEITAPSMNITTDTPLPIFGQENEVSPTFTLVEIAGYVWIFGFIVLLVYAAMRYISLKRRVCFATLVHDNIFETDKIKTPFVLGFINPKIYFPTNIDPTKHDYILKHEQIHIKRRDYLIKPFAYIVFAMHWFNPLMWIAYFLMSKDMEMSCDEAVLRKTDEDIRKNYSMSLLVLSVKRVSLLSPIAFSIGEGNVKERIANVLRFKKSARWITVVSVITVCVFLVGFSSDRVLALDVPFDLNNNTSINTTALRLTDWHTNDHGFRIANPEEVDEFGKAILSTYFSAFRHDWGDWNNATFFLTGGAFSLELYGNYSDTFTRPGGVSINIDGLGPSMRFHNPFLFHINSVTGELFSASYYPPIQFTMTNISPLAPGFEDTIIRGNELLFEAINAEYRKMLLNFSVGILEQSGFGGSDVVSIDFIRFVTGYPRDTFATKLTDSFIGIEVGVVHSNGKSAILTFLVAEEGFAIAGVIINFA